MPRPVRRRVRPNAATANAARVEAAVATRDSGAFEALLAGDATSVDHSIGVELDRPRMLRDYRSFLQSFGAFDSLIISIIAPLDGWEKSTIMPYVFISLIVSRPSGDSPLLDKNPLCSPVFESESWLWPLWASDM